MAVSVEDKAVKAVRKTYSLGVVGGNGEGVQFGLLALLRPCISQGGYAVYDRRDVAEYV